MARADTRVINGLTHEQWREQILSELIFDPKDYIGADAAREKELNELARRLNLALLNLDAIFGMVEATKITYRMAAEASVEKLRFALLDETGGKRRGAAVEGPRKSVEGIMDRLLRGEERLPPARAPVATLLEKDVQNSMKHIGDARRLNAKYDARDAEVLNG